MGTQREGTGKRRKKLGPPFALLLTPRTQRRVGFKYWKWKLPPANKIIVTRSVPGDSVIGAITRLLLLRALPLRVVAGGAFVRHAFGAFYATKLPNLPQFLPLPGFFVRLGIGVRARSKVCAERFTLLACKIVCLNGFVWAVLCLIGFINASPWR